MAFQQPQRQPAARPTTFSTPTPSPAVTPENRPALEQEQQEWILFSPGAPLTQTTSTERTRTAGRSRLSDFGSLDTAARSEQPGPTPAHDDNETEDLDSLDDGLHAFNEPSTHTPPQRTVEQSGETILPNHDGLGTFPGDSSPVQNTFWQFERYNPRRQRHVRRRSSLSRRIDAAEHDDVGRAEEERFQRIEQWRAEQSRVLLEEVEKETRRRRRQSRLGSVKNTRSHSRASVDIPPAPLPSSAPEDHTPPPPPESFWQRITRRVIRDLMGLDEATLSVLFGESVAPTTSRSAPAVLSPIARASQLAEDDQQLVLARESDSWESKLLERISKELGVLVHQISEHPGAFSTYLRTQEQFDYAGLPTPAAFATTNVQSRPILNAHVPGTHFRPTLPRQHRSSFVAADASLWGIEEEEEPNEAAHLEREREYWEKDLDVKMVFGFLRNRFSNTPDTQRQANTSPLTPRSANIASTSTTSPESLRRAALIRHHHPLISTARRQSLMQQAQSRPPPSPILGRRMSEAASSCASQSSKRSKTGRSGSSRNYWDIGAASSAGWGEV